MNSTAALQWEDTIPSPVLLPMIQLSPAAVSEVKRLRLKQVSSNTGRLRLRIDKSGCSGLSYQMEFETDSLPEDHVIHSDDLDIVVDPQSLRYVEGLMIDYTEDLMGGAFCFQNPQASEICNCGTSFNVAEASNYVI